MANASHRILDTETGKQYEAKAAAGRDLAHLVNGDPKDQFVWFQIARTYPERFRVLNSQGDWVRLGDPSGPVGTLRPVDLPTGARSGTRLTTVAIDEQKLAEVKAVLGTSTLKELSIAPSTTYWCARRVRGVSNAYGTWKGSTSTSVR